MFALHVSVISRRYLASLAGDVGLNSILFVQSLLHKYNIIEVGYDSKP